MTKQTISMQSARRAELLAELFLQDLEPQFVAEVPDSDFMFDFFIGFSNPKGGINTFAVVVKSIERPLNSTFALRANAFMLLANSNNPVLLLIVDVKGNEFYYAWPSDHADASPSGESVKIPVARVDSESRRRLIDRLTG